MSSDFQPNDKSFPSFSSMADDAIERTDIEKLDDVVSYKKASSASSSTSNTTVTVNGTVVTIESADTDGSGEHQAGERENLTTATHGIVKAFSEQHHQQTQQVTIVTAEAAVVTTTVQSAAMTNATATTKMVVKRESREKLIHPQHVSAGGGPTQQQCNRVQIGSVKQHSGPAVLTATIPAPTAVAGSGRSSVSSLASSSAGTNTSSSTSCCCGGNRGEQQLQHQQSLNQALAIVANKWDREQRIQDQENTRRLTLLKQRKISAILKVRGERYVFFIVCNVFLKWNDISCEN